MYTRAEKTFEREWGEGHPKIAAAREAKEALMELSRTEMMNGDPTTFAEQQ